MSEYAVMPLNDYINACNKIREKTNSNNEIKSGELSDNIEAVYSGGYQKGMEAEIIREWNVRQSDGYRINYLYAFAGTCWYDSIYNPIYTINASENASFMFCYSRITDTKVPIDLRNSVNNTGSAFDNSKLVTIRKLIVSETTPGLKFNNVQNLENLTVEGVIGNGWTFTGCNKLSVDSMISIINALKDYATYTEKTYSGCFSTPPTDFGWYSYEKKYAITSIDKTDISFIGDDGGQWSVFITNNSLPLEEIAEATHIVIHSDSSVTFYIPEKIEATYKLIVGETNLQRLRESGQNGEEIALRKGWSVT
ncbi:MAG: hypothetical protein U0M42_04840 [Acutalibacteraceae bacterium]|nr:hypothetical protein [Acutalibacteraceae bacterium]